MPKAFARSCGSVTSAIYARAVVMLPPDKPSMMRAANSTNSVRATASIAKLTTVPSRLKIRTGRRPHRSDSTPKAGVASSCEREKDANRKPMTSGEAPKVCA